MTTWNFRGGIAALALTALTACEGELANLSLGGPSPNAALSQARMAFGSVLLVPPQGYCIDGASLKQRFALMARCDKLGAPSAAGFEPIAVITASFSPLAQDASVPDAATTAAALGLENVSAEQSIQGGVTFRATGTPPTDGMSASHWRAITQVDGQIMALALYAPEEGEANTSEGRAMLSTIIDATGPES